MVVPTTQNALLTADASSADRTSDLWQCPDGAGEERAYNHRISTRQFSCEPDGAGHSRA